MTNPLIGKKSHAEHVVKFLALGVSLVSVFGWCFFARPHQAYASDTEIQSCTSQTLPYTVDYLLESTAAFNDAMRTEWQSQYDDEDNSVVIFYQEELDGDRKITLAIYDVQTSSPTYGYPTGYGVALDSSGSDELLRTRPFGGYRYVYTWNYNSSGNLLIPSSYPYLTRIATSDTTWATLLTGTSASSYAEQCVIAVRSVGFSDPLRAADFNTINAAEEGVSDPETGFWNTVTTVLNDIWGFITDLPDFFMSLFVPDESTISTITTDFFEFFDEKMGLLSWPFELLSDFFDIFMGSGISDEFDDFGNTYNWCGSGYSPTSTNASWSFGEFLGSDFRFNGCALEWISPTLWTLATLLARGTLIWGMASFLLSAYRRHIK